MSFELYFCTKIFPIILVFHYKPFITSLVMHLPLQAQRALLQACNGLVINYKGKVLLQPL